MIDNSTYNKHERRTSNDDDDDDDDYYADIGSSSDNDHDDTNDSNTAMMMMMMNITTTTTMMMMVMTTIVMLCAPRLEHRGRPRPPTHPRPSQRAAVLPLDCMAKACMSGVFCSQTTVVEREYLCSLVDEHPASESVCPTSATCARSLVKLPRSGDVYLSRGKGGPRGVPAIAAIDQLFG